MRDRDYTNPTYRDTARREFFYEVVPILKPLTVVEWLIIHEASKRLVFSRFAVRVSDLEMKYLVPAFL